MRKVKFKDYNTVTKEWFEGEGEFHGWGNSFEEFESGPANYTYAIVEDSDGKVWEVAPHHLQFIK